MADMFSKEKRSEIMSHIRSKDTKIEVVLRKNLWQLGFRYLKNPKGYFGRPDLVMPKYKTVVFVDGCFWHGCKKHGNIPKSNRDYWKAKISRNKTRKREVSKHYKNLGWKVIRVWEHDLRSPDIADELSKKITR